MGLDMFLTSFIYGYEEDCISWRKASQIFKFFDTKINGGIENSVEYKIDREILEELVEKCKKVIENPNLAEELLSVKSRLFFGSYGSYEYNYLYFKQLEETIKNVEAILTSKGVFIFQASW